MVLFLAFLSVFLLLALEEWFEVPCKVKAGVRNVTFTFAQNLIGDPL